jgi:hypothetical protein
VAPKVEEVERHQGDQNDIRIKVAIESCVTQRPKVATEDCEQSSEKNEKAEDAWRQKGAIAKCDAFFNDARIRAGLMGNRTRRVCELSFQM